MTSISHLSKKRPPAQPRKGLTSTGARKAASKSPRTRSREFALQALYQFLVSKNEIASIDLFTRNLSGFNKANVEHYEALINGCTSAQTALNAQIEPLLDRPLKEISPIEHSVMWIGTFELQSCLDVPWRVVLNECIELTKEFGGTDGHKYVNAVLNTLAKQLRANEIARDLQDQKPKY